MTSFRVEDQQRREVEIEGSVLAVSSYRMGDIWICHVDNVTTGATIAHARAESREHAESEALELAGKRVRSAQRLRETIDALHSQVASLNAVIPKGKGEPQGG